MAFKHSLFCFVALLFAFLNSFAQPVLPEIGSLKKDGINILSWTNPYESGVKSIAVQRSADSNYNFVTIGFVENLKVQQQSYIDAHPNLGTNWYRVVLTFSSEMEWTSNLTKIIIDSADLLNQKMLPSNDSLQKIIAEVGGNPSELAKVTTPTLPRSRYVFTNPFTGNINIEIEGVYQDSYSLKFYDQKDKEVLDVPRLIEKVIILDKRNFQNTGIYKFKLFKNKEEFEQGYITIY